MTRRRVLSLTLSDLCLTLTVHDTLVLHTLVLRC